MPLLVQSQVLIAFPLMHLRFVHVPLDFLELVEMRQGVVAESFRNNLAAQQLVQSFAKILRQARDAVLQTLFVGHDVDVAVDRSRQRQLVLDAVQAGLQHDGQSQVWIRGRIRVAHFDAGAEAAGSRNADHRAAVACRPGDVARRLVTRHQTLVAVDGRIGDGGHRAGMAQKAGHVVTRRRAESQLIVLVVEGVLSAAEQRLMAVHAGAVDSEQRLRHEGRVQAVLAGDRLDDELERLDLIGRFDSVRVFEVDLMLAWSDLVMGGLDLEVHLLERQHDFAAAVLAEVHRRQIEITALVVELGRRLALLVRLEQEEFGLRTYVHRSEAHFLGFLEHALQNAAGIAGERRAVRHVDVADQAGDAILRNPREYDPSAEVGIKIHIGFLDTDITFDRGAVEHHFIVESFLKLADRNLDVFDRAQQIRELETDESDVLFLGDAHDIFFVVTHRIYSSHHKIGYG
ncbi:Putative uncharacterized protein [Paenibacillus sp. P22]|nr:Putative uncharacterized protein [Paenibacillus sp. P22]